MNRFLYDSNLLPERVNGASKLQLKSVFEVKMAVTLPPTNF